MTPSQPRSFASAGAEPRYARERTYDIAHVRLELRLDERRRTLHGRATLRLAPLHDRFRRLRLDLASDLHVDEVRLAGGRALAFDHRADELHIDLGRPHPAGREIEVTVAYAGSPRRGLYFVGPDAADRGKPRQIWSQGQDEDSRYWFPCYDSPNDKATSEVIATVRRPYRVISNGRLVAVREDRRARTRTFHWREDFPHPAYLTSIVVGEFTEVRAVADGVPLAYYAPPADADKLRRTFVNTPKMLRFFSTAIGYPYPYEKYVQVVVRDFIFGGMENITATTLTDAVLLDRRAAVDFHSDSLLAHELAHQWWGNLLTCKEWSHAWLNEGFATYFDALFTEHHRGRDEFLWQMHGNAREYFREDADKYRRPIVERRYGKPIELFDRHLYEKGALVLHMLRHELGDELFWKAIRHYVRKHQFQNVETTDFKVAIEEATGQHLDRFFDQWVYGSGFPLLSTTWSWNDAQQLVRLECKQTQVQEGGAALAFALDVEIATEAGRERRRVRIESAEQTVYLPCARRPLYVRVDPEHWILMQLHHQQGRDELLAQLRTATDFLAQSDAAEGLARFVGDGEVQLALATGLRRARFFAAKRSLAAALARLGGDATRDTLVAALAERDPRARRGIVKALGEFRGDPRAAAALRRAWPRETSYFVRAETLGALARIGGEGTFEFLERALHQESFRDTIRAAGLRGMGELEDERGIEVARRWLGPGRSRWTRDAALRALAALGRAFPARAQALQSEIERALRDPSFFAILSATDALAKLGRAEAIPALRRVEQSDLDGRLQKAAREAIETLRSRAPEPERLRNLQSQVDQLRAQTRDLCERLQRLEVRLAAAPTRAPQRQTDARRAGSRRGPQRDR